MTDEQRQEFFRLMSAGFKEDEQRYLDAWGKEAAAQLKKLFEELVMAPARAQQEKESTMTPREQIQEHARVAARKIHAIMEEFTEATGVMAQVDVQYLMLDRIDKVEADYRVQDVKVRYLGED